MRLNEDLTFGIYPQRAKVDNLSNNIYQRPTFFALVHKQNDALATLIVLP